MYIDITQRERERKVGDWKKFINEKLKSVKVIMCAGCRSRCMVCGMGVCTKCNVICNKYKFDVYIRSDFIFKSKRLISGLWRAKSIFSWLNYFERRITAFASWFDDGISNKKVSERKRGKKVPEKFYFKIMSLTQRLFQIRWYSYSGKKGKQIFKEKKKLMRFSRVNYEWHFFSPYETDHKWHKYIHIFLYNSFYTD